MASHSRSSKRTSGHDASYTSYASLASSHSHFFSAGVFFLGGARMAFRSLGV
jgi:hypothetical protein